MFPERLHAATTRACTSANPSERACCGWRRACACCRLLWPSQNGLLSAPTRQRARCSARCHRQPPARPGSRRRALRGSLESPSIHPGIVSHSDDSCSSRACHAWIRAARVKPHRLPCTPSAHATTLQPGCLCSSASSACSCRALRGWSA